MSRIRSGFLCLSVLSALAGCAHPPAALEADYLFENVNVVPMDRPDILSDRAVAVRDGEIVAVLDGAEAGRVTADVRIDGEGRYLMPGLADMHVHLRMAPEAFFNLNLANGVTTVINMGLGDGRGRYDHLQLRADVAAGEIAGPRYLVSGPQIHAEQAASLEDVEAILDRHVRDGFDVLKIHGDLDPDIYDALVEGAMARGIRMTGHGQHLMPLAQTLRMGSFQHVEELLYIAEDPDCRERARAGFWDGYFCNLARLEDADYRAGLVSRIAGSGVYVTPTSIIYAYLPLYLDDTSLEALQMDARLDYLPEDVRSQLLDPQENDYRGNFDAAMAHIGQDARLANVSADPERLDDTWAEHFRRNQPVLDGLLMDMDAAGVPLLLGSDCFGGVVPGFGAHQELERMVAAGLTPYQALRTGTVTVADYLGEADRAGTIEAGKRADFILLDGNPLEDVEHASRVRGVFTRGTWYPPEALARLMSDAQAALDDNG